MARESDKGMRAVTDLLFADILKADAVCPLAIPIFVKYPDCI